MARHCTLGIATPTEEISPVKACKPLTMYQPFQPFPQFQPFQPFRHHYNVIPGLLTIRSSFRWTLPKLLVTAALIVIGLLILKRFGAAAGQGQAPTWTSRVFTYNDNDHNTFVSQSQRGREWQPRSQSASPPRQSESWSYHPDQARSSRAHNGAGTASFIPTWRRRKRLTKKQKAQLLHTYNGQCAICHHVLQPFDTEFDHIEALATDPLGLRHSTLNSLSNF
jgi:hypothetical protein